MKKKDELPVSICVLGISSHDGNELLLTYYKKREDQIRGGMGSEGEIRGGIRGGMGSEGEIRGGDQRERYRSEGEIRGGDQREKSEGGRDQRERSEGEIRGRNQRERSEGEIRGGMRSEGEIRGVSEGEIRRGIRGREGESEEEVGDYEGPITMYRDFPSSLQTADEIIVELKR